MTDLAKRAAELIERARPGPWRFHDGEFRGRESVVALAAPVGYQNSEIICDEPDASIMALAPELAAEVVRLTADNARLREAVLRYVEWQGPCANHHRDDCPGDCAACEIDLAISAAIAATDKQVKEEL